MLLVWYFIWIRHQAGCTKKHIDEIFQAIRMFSLNLGVCESKGADRMTRRLNLKIWDRRFEFPGKLVCSDAVLETLFFVFYYNSWSDWVQWWYWSPSAWPTSSVHSCRSPYRAPTDRMLWQFNLVASFMVSSFHFWSSLGQTRVFSFHVSFSFHGLGRRVSIFQQST